MVILDTCAIIELLRPQPSISEKVIYQIEKEATLLSISFAEIACKVSRNLLSLGSTTVLELYHAYREIPAVQIIDINTEHWLESIFLDWPIEKKNAPSKQHKDPADRLLLSFALKYKIPIITTDQLLIHRYEKCLW